MRRRALLVGLTGALGGCTAVLPRDGAVPEEPRPDQVQLLLDFDWRPDASELEVTIRAGNTLTRENTSELYVRGVRDSPEKIFWVARDERARAEFPVGPGDSVTVSVADTDLTARVVHVTPDRIGQTLGQYEFDGASGGDGA